MDKKFYISTSLMIAAVVLVFSWDKITISLHPLFYIFIYSIPSNTAISVFPHEPVLVYLGRFNTPLLLATAASLGTILAGILDYYVFVPLFSHRALNNLKSTKGYQTAIRRFNYQPFLALTIAAFGPLPFFIFKFIAFAAFYPLYKFLIAKILGRFPRYYLLAMVGEILQVPVWILVAIFAGMLSIYLIKGYPHIIRYFRQRRAVAEDSEEMEVGESS